MGRWNIRVLLMAIYILAATALASCGSRHGDGPDDFLVFAGASLQEVMEAVGQAYQAEFSTDVAFSFGGSQALAQQIASGAPADAFFPAGSSPMEFLRERELVGQPTNVVSNRLVVAVRGDAALGLKSMSDLTGPDVDRLGVADPELAPAGRYAQEALQSLGLWDELIGRMVFGLDVRTTLAFVESGNVDAAIVYETDARGGKGLISLDIVPEDSYSHVVYPVAVVWGSSDLSVVLGFMNFLIGEEAMHIFSEYGFEPAE